MSMLRIQTNQIVAMEEQLLDGFLDRIAAFLRANVPSMRGADTAELAIECRPFVEKARRYGFRTEREIASFVFSAAVLGSDLDEAIPSVAAILRGEWGRGREKARQLEELTLKTFQILER
jgi:hypothetical protein